MKQLFLLVAFNYYFVCFGQTIKKPYYSDVNVNDILEIKDLIYFKKDTTLVTGKVIQYDKRFKPIKYIWVIDGKPDYLGWQLIYNEGFVQPQESTLGSALLGVGQVLEMTNTINIPTSRKSHSSDPNIDTYLEYNKQFIKTEAKNLSERNKIYNNLESNDFSNLNVKPKDGLVMEFYDNIKLKSKGNYIKGEKYGAWEDYYSNGKIKSKGNFKEGKEEGLWLEYYDTGQLKKKGNYIEFLKEGVWEVYYNNGKLESKVNYLKGKNVGRMEVYHPNGNLKVRLNYIDGKEDGLMELYHRDGQLMLKGYFKDGKEIGDWKTYDNKGKLIKTENFD